MERTQFTEHMRRLWGYYGKEPTAIALEEWWREMQRTPEFAAHEAVTRTLRYSRTMPSLGDFMRTVSDVQPNKKFKEEEAKAPEPTPEDRAFGAEMMPVMGRMFRALTLARRKGDEARAEEVWGAYVLHMYGVATKHRVAHRIKWQDLDGMNGFKVPPAWVRAGSHQTPSEPMEDQ